MQGFKNKPVTAENSTGYLITCLSYLLFLEFEKNLETLVVLIFHQNYLGAVITIQQPFVELFIITYDKVENITQAGTS